MRMFALDGRRALVTGASRGLGRHFAMVLARAGAEVILAARDRRALDEAAREIGNETGRRAQCLALDVADGDAVREAVAGAGPLDILVNNAGVTRAGPLLDVSAEDFDFVMNANLRGAFMVAQAAAAAMRDAGKGGAIVNIASIVGLRQGSQLTAYAMSKAGVVQMTRQMALELARFHIRVNAIAPGYFVTDMNRDHLEGAGGDAMLRRIPQRRFGEFPDLDGPLLLLCSDAGRYMTGAVVPVDGGHMVASL